MAVSMFNIATFLGEELPLFLVHLYAIQSINYKAKTHPKYTTALPSETTCDYNS